MIWGMEPDDFLTIPETAQALGLAVPSVHDALYGGRLAFVKMYGRKLIARAEVESYRARTQPTGSKRRGRPAGSKNQTKIMGDDR